MRRTVAREDGTVDNNSAYYEREALSALNQAQEEDRGDYVIATYFHERAVVFATLAQAAATLEQQRGNPSSYA
jgi:hypothetical protein